MNIVIIPARGGSKGIPKKNIIDLAGRPLIAWSIEQAKNSQLVDVVFVSTDDDEIADISLLHAIDFIECEKKIAVDIVVFLQATSPVRERADIDNAIRRFLLGKADSLFSCVRLRDYFIWEKGKDNYFSVNYDYHYREPRQHVRPQYLENGSIYIFTPELVRREHNRLGGKIEIYEMESWKSFQIDNWDDVDICEYYIKTRLLKQESEK